MVYCCQRPLPEKGGVKPTQLFSRNADVDRVNTAELTGLPHPQATLSCNLTAQSPMPCTVIHRSWRAASKLLLMFDGLRGATPSKYVHGFGSLLLKQWLQSLMSP